MDEAVQRYVGAFEELQSHEGKDIRLGLKYLVAHAEMPSRTASMRNISRRVGVENFNVGNSSYGKLAHKVFDLVNYIPTSDEQKRGSEYLICLTDLNPKKDSVGEYQHILKEVAYKALIALDWVNSNINLSVEDEIKQKSTELQSLPDKTRDTIIKARLGQGKFRQQLIDFWEGCSVTGFPLYEFLIASHIKPWRVASVEECLSVTNGLLLTPNLDKAFDLGLISFENDGSIIVSSRLTQKQAEELGVESNMKIRKVFPDHHVFLEYHRERVFRP